MPSITGILMSESSRSNAPFRSAQISAAMPPSSASVTSWPIWARARDHEGPHIVIVFGNQNTRHHKAFDGGRSDAAAGLVKLRRTVTAPSGGALTSVENRSTLARFHLGVACGVTVHS